MDVSQYLEVFIDESDEHLQTLSDCIMVLEKEPENMDTINEIFRAECPWLHILRVVSGQPHCRTTFRCPQELRAIYREAQTCLAIVLVIIRAGCSRIDNVARGSS